MDFENSPPSTSLVVKCSDCRCWGGGGLAMNRSYSGTWLRSVKRKYDEFEDDDNDNKKRFFVPGLDIITSNARVEIGNECVLLREMVSNQQQCIDELSVELEEERNAASTAANEAMSMMLRLQREKAESQMEARQFKRFVEEKMAHDQQEILILEDLLYKREQTIQSLTCEVQAYKHRLMSYGLTESEAEGKRGSLSRNSSAVDNADGQLDSPSYMYPPIRCSFNENHIHPESDDDVVDVEKYAFGETPKSRDTLKDLEFRINQLEKSPRHSLPLEKVIVGYSPREPKHSRKFSTDSAGSFIANIKEMGPDFVSDSPKFASLRKMDCSQAEDYSTNPKKMDNLSDVGEDMADRVYTIDAIHSGASSDFVPETKASVGVFDDYLSTPKESFCPTDIGDPEIKKLYMRLQVLEADRESMRQALISMRTDKAQLVLLKEIAQQLCKEMTPARRLPIKKTSFIGTFSVFTVFKWIASFIFWRKRARRSRYLYNLTTQNPGLLMLLDKGPRVGQWRCLSSTQV